MCGILWNCYSHLRALKHAVISRLGIPLCVAGYVCINSKNTFFFLVISYNIDTITAICAAALCDFIYRLAYPAYPAVSHLYLLLPRCCSVSSTLIGNFVGFLTRHCLSLVLFDMWKYTYSFTVCADVFMSHMHSSKLGKLAPLFCGGWNIASTRASYFTAQNNMLFQFACNY